MANDKQYNVFHRTWWKEATTPGWPNDLEPEAGEKTYLVEGVIYAEAIEVAAEYNDSHTPGRLNRKAEIEEA